MKIKTAIIPIHNSGFDSKQTQKQAHKQGSRGAQQRLVLFAVSIVYRVLYTLLVKQVKHDKNNTYNTYALGNEAKVHLLNEHMLLIHQA